MVALPQLPRVRRSELQPYIAEFFGVVLLIVLGDGVIAQVLLSDHQNGSWLSINFAWAVAVALTCYVSSPSPSVNPAVSIVSAIIHPSREQWRQLPGKLLAQFLGGFVGAAIVYLNYRTAIRAWDPEYTIPGGSILSPHGHHSAGIFATYPATHLQSNWEGVVQEALGAAVLMFGALAIGDDKHGSKFGSPVLGMFLLLLGIGTSLGWQTGYAVNPARDFGPRLFSAIIYGREVFTAAGYYCFVPLLAPVLGCFIGAVVYDAFLFEGESSTVTNAVDRAEERLCNPDGELRLED